MTYSYTTLWDVTVLSVAVGSGTHMMMEYDDTDTIVMMGETGATVQRVPG